MTKPMTIREQFEEFAEANPQVLVALLDLTRELKRRGHERYSMKGLFEVLRHRHALKTTADDFKLNNNYTAHYARLIMDQYPEFEGFFALRGRGAPEVIEEPDLFGRQGNA